VTTLHPTLAYHVTGTLGWPRLRPLQEAAFAPIGDGIDTLLIAPTAGGKTEAVMFPLLTVMEEGKRSRGLSVIYVCPLKALLTTCCHAFSCTRAGSADGLSSGTVTYQDLVGRRSFAIRRMCF
jgi:replicative superfamily II helicase